MTSQKKKKNLISSYFTGGHMCIYTFLFLTYCLAEYNSPFKFKFKTQ